MTSWHLAPGDKITRKELHENYGGSHQGGMTSSTKSPNVFLFTDPKVGERHGYFDDWQPDKTFHYTGEGRYGDQQFTSANKALLNHRTDNRSVRLFQGVGGPITYIGEFAVDHDNPFSQGDAPETGNGPLRRVIIFKLHPVDVVAKIIPTERLNDKSDKNEEVDIESKNSEHTMVSPTGKPYKSSSREAELVGKFKKVMENAGHVVKRNKIFPPREISPIFSDIYIGSLSLLVEAKGSVSRESIRMAIGQLYDYRRFVMDAGEYPKCALLLPERPRADLLELVRHVGFDVIWPAAGDEFECTSPAILGR